MTHIFAHGSRAPIVAALLLVASVLGLSVMSSREIADEAVSPMAAHAATTTLARTGTASPDTQATYKPFVFSAPLTRPADIARVQISRLDGTTFRLEALRGKHVLLNVWATWCAPCREEMPALDRLQARLGAGRFEVVALSIDASIKDVRDFYAGLNIQSLQIYLGDYKEAPALLNVRGIPTTLLIDRDGREVARFVGPATWDADAVVAAITGHIETNVPTRSPK